jgi:hypothetical protein
MLGRSKDQVLGFPLQTFWHCISYLIQTCCRGESNNNIVVSIIIIIKSPGKDQINSELYKYAGNNFHNRLLQFFNMVYLSKTIPNEWRRSITVPVLKKG